jgi:hypothetical protein
MYHSADDKGQITAYSVGIAQIHERHYHQTNVQIRSFDAPKEKPLSVCIS